MCPQYNGRIRELRVGKTVLKRFRRQPAPDQEELLGAFQQQNWQELIDDPLSHPAGVNRKRRRRDTVHNLNRSLKKRLIHFYTDGNGHIGWEWNK